MLEITKMLTLSTAHITDKTKDWLKNKSPDAFEKYLRGEFGWFIFICVEDIDEYLAEVPSDLEQVLRFAAAHGCVWVCLDIDGDTVKQLPVYNW